MMDYIIIHILSYSLPPHNRLWQNRCESFVLLKLFNCLRGLNFLFVTLLSGWFQLISKLLLEKKKK